PAVGLAEVVEAADVFVRHLSRDPKLVVELGEPCGVGSDAFGQELQRDRLIQGQVLGAIDLTHAAAAQQRDEPVPAGDDRHGRKARPASPAGDTSTVINGKWIDITYGRPLKRGRDVFPAGADYAKITHTDGAPVWRAGANVTTRLKTEAPLVINSKTVPAGE